MKTKSTLMPLLVRGFFILMILAVEILPFLYFTNPAEADAWYNSSWLYRKSFTISHASGTLTNYQMPIKVYYASGTDGTEVIDNATTALKIYLGGKCKTDFTDVIVTNSSNTKMDHYAETTVSSNYSFRWIEFDSIGTGATTFYIYYGNSGAAASDNGTNTFIKFDNFEWGSDGTVVSASGGGLAWSVSGAANSTISTDQAASGTRSLKVFGDASAGVNVYFSLTASTQTYAIRYKIYKPDASQYNFSHSNSVNQNQLFSDSSENIYYITDGSNVDTGANMTADSWRNFMLKDFNFTAKTFDVIFDTALILDNGGSYNVAYSNNIVNFSTYAAGAGNNFYLDDLMVLNWNPTAPAWGSVGSETLRLIVNTNSASSITTTTASVSGNVTDSNYTLSKYGAQYGLSDSFGSWDNVTNTVSSFPFAWTDNITGLSAASLYYYRAFAENSTVAMFVYGSTANFLTLPAAPSGLTATGADTVLNCTWTNAAAGSGTTNYTQVQYSTSAYPTTYSDGTTGISWTTGTSGQITGLTNGVLYYVSAFTKSVNGAYTQYSIAYAQATGTPAAVASVTTDNATLIEETTATTGGNITSLNGAGNCTVRGIEYGTTSGAPYANTSSESGSFGTGSFTRNLTSLTKGELYYFRAFATNIYGDGYGTEKTFLTKPDEPSSFVVAASSSTEITITWAKGTGAQTTIIRGSQAGYPATVADGTSIYNSTGTSTTHSGLSTGQTWYYRAWSYATEGGLTQYSDAYGQGYDTTFIAPSVSTRYSTGRAGEWVVVNGSVTSTGSPSTITVRGFDYGLSTSYGSASTETDISGFGTGNYSNVLTGLSPNTVYHYRAKAYNGTWAYGSDQTVSTRDSLLDVAFYQPTSTDNTSQAYGNYYLAQTFTTDNITPLNVSKIRLKLYKQATTVTAPVYVSLRTATADNVSDVDLATATVASGTILLSADSAIQEVTLSSVLSLEVNRKYAVVVYSPTAIATSSEYYYWRRVQAGTYSGGTAMSSSNSGLTWTSVSGDFWFEILGTETLQIQDAKIYMSYKEDDDWLITCRYLNTVAPYYDTYDIKKYFAVQLTDSSGNIKGQNILSGWGNKVTSIYQAAVPADNLTWGGSYRLRIQGLFSPYPYTEYVFQDTDWQGDDMSLLDNWIITSGTVIGTYYNSTMTTYVSGKGEVLNSAGGAILSNGISGLEIERPDIFQISTSSMAYAGVTTPQGFRQEKQSAFDTNWGPQGTTMWQNWEDLLGINKEYFAAAAFFIAVLVLALVAFPAGHTTASLVLSFIFLGAGIGFGVDLIYLILIGLCASFLLFKQFFMDK